MLLRVAPHGFFSWLFLHSSSLLPFLLSIPLVLPSLTDAASGSERLSLLRSGLALQQSRCAIRGKSKVNARKQAFATRASLCRWCARKAGPSWEGGRRASPACDLRPEGTHRHSGRRVARALGHHRQHQRLNGLVSWALWVFPRQRSYLQQAHGKRGQQARASASGLQPGALAGARCDSHW